MTSFLVLFLGLTGLVAGSFLAALTYRLPRNISIKTGRSICPNCKKKISWYDNIPILSFLLLGGKCRNCSERIPIRYPLIELAGALGFIGAGYFATNLWTLPYLLIVFSVLVAIFVIDFEHQLIPDSLVFFLLIVQSSWFIVHISPDIYTKIAAGFFSALFLLSIHFITGGRGMGLGDVKFALFGGAFFGWPGSFAWLLSSFLTGGAFAIILILLGRAHLKQKIAFGPFLIVGFVITFIWGEKIISLILNT